jgi:hypothetical protein
MKMAQKKFHFKKNPIFSNLGKVGSRGGKISPKTAFLESSLIK